MGRNNPVTQPPTKGWALLQRQVVSGAPSNVDFPTVFTTDYDIYKIVFTDIFPSITDDQLSIRFTSNGSTYLAGSTDYYNAGAYTTTNFSNGVSAGPTSSGGQQSFCGICPDVTNLLSDAVHGEITVYDPMNASTLTTGYVNSGRKQTASILVPQPMLLMYNQIAAICGFRLLWTGHASTFGTGGVVSVYGLKH